MKRLLLAVLFFSCTQADPPGIIEFANWMQDHDGTYFFGITVADQDSITARYFSRELAHAATDSGDAGDKLSHLHVRKLLSSLDSAYRKQDREAIAAWRDSLTRYITQWSAHLTVRQAIVPDSMIIVPDSPIVEQ